MYVVPQISAVRAARKSGDMRWLEIEPLTGTVKRGSSMSVALKGRSTEGADHGMTFVRVDDGLSVPVTVICR